MKKLLIAATMLALISFTIPDQLTGTWETQVSPNGNVTRVVFKSDNTFEGFINNKPFVTGSYKFENDILSFVDNGCEGKKGVYKIVFFGNADSLRFEPIQDSCEERRNGMIRTVLGRVK